jgi:hypothetical protein
LFTFNNYLEKISLNRKRTFSLINNGVNMKLFRLLFILSIILLLALPAEELFSQNYVGSSACQGCHSGKHADWITSGHPYKIQKLENGQGPQYPPGLTSTKVIGPYVTYTIQPGVPMPPKGYTWQTVGFVLGGYHSNARFLDTLGYVIIGDTAQYNIPTNKWVKYIQSPPGTQPYLYSCYKCHTTGPSPTKTPPFEPYPGIEGSWAEAGVGCEACHGPASEHIGNPTIHPPKEGYETCNTCHARDRSETNKRVEWLPTTYQGISTGFIRHREQGDMMLASKHHIAGMTCVTCHDPHKSVYYELGGLKASVTCEGCHPNHIIAGHGTDKASCTDCHMPNAARNGDHLSQYVSEQSAHFWNILTDPITMFENLDTTFVAGKKYIKVDGNGFSGLTLDYTCLQCHITQDVNWAAQYADNIHQVGVGVENEGGMPTAYNLGQNYPNPFNPSTRIDYSVAISGNVNISVYSITGEKVTTLVNEYLPAGRYTVDFVADNITSGVYLYKITSGNFSLAKKMIVMK